MQVCAFVSYSAAKRRSSVYIHHQPHTSLFGQPQTGSTSPRTCPSAMIRGMGDSLAVLGCCIVLVFAIGLVKLWWTNRAMRRLEIIDEEKRARVSLMSHCGIENLRPPEIPFGIRAIQNGVQVEGIWISRPDTPESNHKTPGATLVGHRVEMSKGKGRMIELGKTCPNPSIESQSISTHQPQQDDTISPVEPFNYHTQLGQSMSTPPHQHLCSGRQRNWRRSDTSTSMSLRDPFGTPAQTPTTWSLSQVSAVGSELDYSASELALSVTEQASLRHGVTRATRGRVSLPTGFKPDAADRAQDVTHYQIDRLHQQVEHGLAPNKASPGRTRLQKVARAEDGSKREVSCPHSISNKDRRPLQIRRAVSGSGSDDTVGDQI
ncbi:hypothetical protein CEP54_003181 [Fusarium duplospermum]|uniref:Uncharacterized protein n=1 Tax=Fusarium duplospermum TaxID=1325734 RepID=A0A428QQ98_9HYPO|nr:hypothetical protein CEP54_003181 [Fusarium duplospermum]